MVALVEDDLVLAEVAPDADGLGREAGDPGDLGARLGRLGRGIDADHPPLPLPVGEAGDHAGLGGAGDRAHDDRVEEDAELALLRLHLAGPRGEAQAAERVVGRARRDRVRASRRRP